MGDDIEQKVINYIREVDRAVTIDELADQVESDPDVIKQIVENLRNQDVLSSDFYYSGSGKKTARYYPADRLFK